MTAVLIGLAGMLGALLRFGADAVLARSDRFGPGKAQHWPLATLAVNAVGSLVIGLVGGLSTSARLSEQWHLAFATGLAGGLTTFSSFTLATVLLWREKRRVAAGLNLLTNLLLGLGFAWLGFLLGS